ncbi:MAG: hypothetical protein WAV00_12150 [Nocardioides sp.]
MKRLALKFPDRIASLRWEVEYKRTLLTWAATLAGVFLAALIAFSIAGRRRDGDLWEASFAAAFAVLFVTCLCWSTWLMLSLHLSQRELIIRERMEELDRLRPRGRDPLRKRRPRGQ